MAPSEPAAAGPRPSTQQPRSGPGRRPAGSEPTRDVILAAARAQFAQRGFDGTTMRSVAQEAGVDASLISHFFGSKQGLFEQALQPPDISLALPQLLLHADPTQWGSIVARTFLTGVNNPAISERVVGILRAAATQDHAAQHVRGLLEEHMVAQLEGLPIDHVRARAVLMVSTIMGLVVTGKILSTTYFLDSPQPAQEALLASTLQTILTTPMPTANPDGPTQSDVQ